MGITVGIYRRKFPSYPEGNKPHPSCVFGSVDEVTVVNVEGPFGPTPQRPAALLVPGVLSVNVVVVPAVQDSRGQWVQQPGLLMAGGDFASTSDSRWSRAVEQMTRFSGWYGAVPVHDLLATSADLRALD